MPNINRVTIAGHIGQDPEIKAFDDGNKIATLSIATNEKWKSKEGELQEKTDWHRIVVKGKAAGIAEKYLKKGDAAMFEGKLQTRKYTDKDGIEKHITEVVAFQLHLLGSKQGGTAEQANKDEAKAVPKQDDLPF